MTVYTGAVVKELNMYFQDQKFAYRDMNHLKVSPNYKNTDINNNKRMDSIHTITFYKYSGQPGYKNW